VILRRFENKKDYSSIRFHIGLSMIIGGKGDKIQNQWTDREIAIDGKYVECVAANILLVGQHFKNRNYSLPCFWQNNK
jgi:hypothetical protein